MTEAEAVYELRQVIDAMQSFLPSTGVLLGLGAGLAVRNFWNWGGLPAPVNPQDKLRRSLFLTVILIMRIWGVVLGGALFAIAWWAWPSGVTETRLADLTVGVLFKATGAVVAYLVSAMALFASAASDFND
jgi:hypothetical protein